MNILFMCTYNSCRSQMAEGLARKILPADTEVYSAGLYKAGVNPIAARVLNEIGIDVSSQYSKTYEEVPFDKIDKLVVLCDIVCPLNLPLPDHAKRIDWPTLDPGRSTGSEEEILEVFRKVRDELKKKIEEL